MQWASSLSKAHVGHSSPCRLQASLSHPRHPLTMALRCSCERKGRRALRYCSPRLCTNWSSSKSTASEEPKQLASGPIMNIATLPTTCTPKISIQACYKPPKRVTFFREFFETLNPKPETCHRSPPPERVHARPPRKPLRGGCRSTAYDHMVELEEAGHLMGLWGFRVLVF